MKIRDSLRPMTALGDSAHRRQEREDAHATRGAAEPDRRQCDPYLLHELSRAAVPGASTPDNDGQEVQVPMDCSAVDEGEGREGRKGFFPICVLLVAKILRGACGHGRRAVGEQEGGDGQD